VVSLRASDLIKYTDRNAPLKISRIDFGLQYIIGLCYLLCYGNFQAIERI